MGQMIPDKVPRAAMALGGNDVAKSLPKGTTFTDKVITATGPNADKRIAEVVPSLVRHLHDFAREVNLTVAEWMAAVEFVRTSLLILSPSWSRDRGGKR